MASTGNQTPTFPLAAGIVSIRLVIQTNSSKHVNYLNAIAKDSTLTLQRLSGMFSTFTSGAFRSNVDINTNGSYASGTATCASVVNANTITIAGTVLTATNSATPTNAQFTVGANNNATAANLAAANNLNTTLINTVFANVATNVVTIFCRVPGLIGNLVTLTQTGGTISLSGAVMTAGADGTQSTVAHGL